MLKKVLLATMFVSCFNNEMLSVPVRIEFFQSLPGVSFLFRKDVEVSEKVIKSAAAVALVAALYKTGSYWMSRESNTVKIEKVNCLLNQVHPYFKFHTLQDVQEFLIQFKELTQPVACSNKEISNRYNTWLKPWNWSKDMKQAHGHIQILGILFGYQDIICACDELVDENVVVKHIKKRSKGAERFPLCSFVSQVKADLQVLYSSADSCQACGFELLITPVLENILDTVLESDEYVGELRLKEIEEIQRRAAQAAVQAACR